jgi:hypothetical protein
LSSCDFLDRVPEIVFQAHTRLSAIEVDKPFEQPKELRGD